MTGVGYAVGTGRCGTKFLAELLARDPEIAACHERHPFNDTFHRYCRWYGIPVDEAGFVETKKRAIAEDVAAKAFSFEASAFLSLSLETLHRRLGARIIMMVRRPDRVVASYLQKGWYKTDPVVEDARLPPSMQNVAEPHHFLGRTMPVGDEFERWRKLTRVGKISWFWNALNQALLDQAAAMPAHAAALQKLEDLDFEAYRSLMRFLGAPANLTEADFVAVRRKRPNASAVERGPHQWSDLERKEFEAEVKGMAERLGYEWNTDALIREPAPSRTRSKLANVRPILRRVASRMRSSPA